MKQVPIWVVIANSSFAEIYLIQPGEREVQKILHQDFPAAREKGTAINSDRPGRSHARFGAARHAYGPEVDLKTHEKQVFSHAIADALRKEHGTRTIEKLVLICPPDFLGQLRAALSEPLQKSIYKELDIDIPEYLSDNERIDKIYKLLEIKRPPAARLFSTE